MNLLALALCCLVNGHITGASGSPIADARVELQGTGGGVAHTDANGEFHVQVESGTYSLHASAQGYAPTAAGPFLVNRDVRIDVTLEPLDTPQLRVIGSVRVDGRLALQRDAVPAVDVRRSDMSDLGLRRIIDALPAVPSVTLPRPDGGSPAAPSLVALRGPDPSETLIALDGEILNDANTGDLDLSRFPVAAFSNVSITEGLGPSDTEGSNTIGGAVNIISLRPTRDPHSAFSLSSGSFGTNEAWYNASGSHSRFGYAFALDDQQDQGYVDQDVNLCTAAPPANPCATLTPTHLGSTISSRAFLARTSWSFSQQADLSLRVFALGNTRDESGVLNTPVNSNDESPGAPFTGPGPATFDQNVRSYLLDGRSPLGTGTLIYGLGSGDNDVTYAGTGISPYDVTHRDRRTNEELSWQRSAGTSDIAFGGYLRQESLVEDGVSGTLSQAIASYFVRGSIRPSKRLRVRGGLFESKYTTFGSNLDGRIGLDYDLNADSVARASVGTGFRAPLLIERYVFPANQLPLDQNCVAVGQGNPNEQPEHATEYELGYAHTFSGNANLDASLYWTNLRDPIENYYPLGASCPAQTPPLQSFPINVGNAVYEGGELRYTRRFSHLLLSAAYGLNIAYPINMPATVANPTSGGNLVANQQFLNIPQQQGSLGASWSNAGWHAAFDTTLRGKNNELNQGAYAFLNAAVGHDFGRFDVTLAGTNLTNAVAGRFTLPGLGEPYRGITAFSNGSAVYGPLPTDLFFVEPAAARLIVTFRT